MKKCKTGMQYRYAINIFNTGMQQRYAMIGMQQYTDMHYRYGRKISKNDMHKEMQDSIAMIDMQYRYTLKRC